MSDLHLFIGLVLCSAIITGAISNSANLTSETLSGSGNNKFNLDSIDHLINNYKHYYTAKTGLKIMIAKFVINELLPFPHKMSTTCRQDVKYTLTKLLSSQNEKNILDYWPLKMLDSFGKPDSGLLLANHYWLGSFDECVDTEARGNTTSEVLFVGEYCLAKITLGNGAFPKAPFNISLNVGMCFPSTCSLEDKQYLLNSVMVPFKDQLNSISITKELCQTKAHLPFDSVTYVTITILFIPVLLVCVATITDYIWSHRKNKRDESGLKGICSEMLMAFSAIRSLKTIFKMNEVNSNLSAMHGVRFISMAWVIVGHIGLQSLEDYPWKNQLDVKKIFNYFVLQPFALDAMFSVSTFFTLSGFLVTYLFMKQITERHGRHNVFVFYLYRYLRLTPSYIMVLAMAAGPYIHIAQGPIWNNVVSTEMNICRHDWWKNLLYINSMDELGNQCYRVSWYLSADTIFYVLAPLFLYPLYIKPLVAFILFGLFCIASSIYTLTVILSHHYSTYTGVNPETWKSAGSFVQNVYPKPWLHFSTYAIGMIAGYFLFVYENKKIIITKKITVPGWIISILVLCLIIYGKFPYFHGDKVMSPFLNAFYGIFSRPAWAICVSWLIFACAIGSGGIINLFLSMWVFTPLSRLTYSAYLVHFLVVGYFFYSQKQSVYFSIINVFLMSSNILMITMVAALGLAMVTEFPIIELMKQLRGRYWYSSLEKRAIASPLSKDTLYLGSSEKDTSLMLPHTLLASSDSSDSEYTH